MQDNGEVLGTRLQNGMFGVPDLHPDEQHRYLGTFYERVELQISFKQALRYDFTSVLVPVLRQPRDYQLLLNGQLDMDIMGRYMRLANQYSVLFTVKNSHFYHHNPDSAAIILCADHALNRTEVDILQRYPQIAQR
ncbi:YueI family protein [Lactiplantibacillus argentoratensis]|uniref:YueI family protein n=1 Tax=Lactiplantibacillus argentoratensis TaxID=271881 RepID=UPI003F53714A